MTFVGVAADGPVPEQTLWQKIRWRLRYYRHALARKIPRLVWPGDELDVRVTFTAHKLNPDDPFASLFSGAIADLRQHMRAVGVDFDTGCGPDGYDWEWDWSLSGPISVQFKSRAERPGNRRSRPQPRLAVDNTRPAA